METFFKDMKQMKYFFFFVIDHQEIIIYMYFFFWKTFPTPPYTNELPYVLD